jgi:hypothetical protein
MGNLYVDTCQEAVSLLNKSDIKNGKKMASDPAYNMAAQLLGALLNIRAGAFSCPTVQTEVDAALALLVKYNFLGTGSYGNKMSAADQSLANTLASELDAYNNNNYAICPP